MNDKREIKENASHCLQGAHFQVPIGFVPLCLLTEPGRTRIEVNRPMVIVGRHSGAGLRLAFPDVSRRHCRFAFENGQWRIYDLQSLNGVFLNDEQIVEATMYAGDHLRIANVDLLVEAATPVRILRSLAAEDQHEKLRQIVRFLPADTASK